MLENSENIKAKNVALQTGDNNTQYITFNELITISRDVITTKTFNPVSPYKGLKKFEPTVADSKHFFGRDQLIRLLMQELDNSNLLLLLGASGSGKSSVIQAGLIPRFEEKLGSNYKTFIFKPDRDPFLSLFMAFSREYGQDNASIAQLEKEHTLIEIVKTLKAKEQHWLIYIDQFEEIFHLSDGEKGKKFIKALVSLYQYLQSSKDLSVKIVMTIRTDFLDKFSAYPEFKDITITQKNIEMIADMKPDELRQAIEQPAAQNGVVFEDGLVKEIINDIKDQPGYLPLLQYTLDLLWKNDDNLSHDRTLNISTYRNLGGVRGALQKHIEEIYQKLSENEQEAVRKIFLKLVDVERNQELGTLQKAVSKRAKVSEFQGELIQANLKKLIDNNLIVSQATTSGEATVEIAHEILLSSWETLRRWIEDAYQVIGIRNDLVKSLHRWQETKYKDSKNAYKDFLTGSLLAEVIAKRDSKNFDVVLGGLTTEENQFITDSFAYSERQKNEKIRMAQRIAAGSLMAVVISSGLGLTAWNQKNQSELNKAESLGRYSLSLFGGGRHLEAFVLAIKAGKILHTHKKNNPDVLNALQTLTFPVKERNHLEGHNNLVKTVSFSPNGKILASGSDDNTIKIWNVETGEIINTLEGYGNSIISLSFSPYGNTLISVCNGNDISKKVIELWDVKTGKKIKRLAVPGNNNRLIVFSPDGNTFAVSGFRSDDNPINMINIFNLKKRKKIHTLKVHARLVESLSFSPDGKIFASGSDKNIKIWNVETGEEIHTLKGHVRSVDSLSFSLDGKTLASGSYDGSIKLWNVETGQEIHTLQVNQLPINNPITYSSVRINSLSFSSDGQTLTSGSDDKTIKLWNVETGKEIHTLKGHNLAVNSLSFSPDGKTLASGSNDNSIKLWSLEQSKGVRDIKTDATVTGLSFSPDGKTLASAAEVGGIIELWNLETGKQIDMLEGYGEVAFSVSFSHDGKTLASGTDMGAIRIWNTETRKEILTIKKQNEESDIVYSISYSPDSKTLASGGDDKTIKIFDVETGKKIHTLQGHSEAVRSVSYSPDGKTLASGSYDKTIKIWNIETGKEIYNLKGHSENVTSLSYSPDGKILASGGDDKTIKIWNVETGKEIHTLTGHIYLVNSVNFSPDGKILASGSVDNKIKLWDVKTGKEIRTLTGHSLGVNSVIFSPDGKTLASGSVDSSIKLWDLPDLELEASLRKNCDWVRNYLTYNPNLSESDRHLCDDIGGKK